jgi:hypothetical protein
VLAGKSSQNTTRRRAKQLGSAFDTFNNAQFDGAGAVDGNRDDATFGQILKSQPGRVSQVALKLQF